MRQYGRLIVWVLLIGTLAISGVSPWAASQMPLIVILDPGPAVTPPPPWIQMFKQGLAEHGWVEGRNVTIEIRYADGQPDRMAALAREAVALDPTLLFTHGTNAMLRPVTQATKTIPIVIGAGGDLVDAGFAESLGHPGGNVTGMTLLYRDLEVKRLEVLTELGPKVRRVGIIVNPLTSRDYDEVVSRRVRPLGLELKVVRVSNSEEIHAAVIAVKNWKADALLVQDDPMFTTARAELASVALSLRLPSISQLPGFAEAGGLLQYGVRMLETFRHSAGHVDKILRGAKPGDLPIEQPTDIELVVNQKTAKALGVVLPSSLLARANRVIE